MAAHAHDGGLTSPEQGEAEQPATVAPGPLPQPDIDRHPTAGGHPPAPHTPFTGGPPVEGLQHGTTTPLSPQAPQQPLPQPQSAQQAPSSPNTPPLTSALARGVQPVATPALPPSIQALQDLEQHVRSRPRAKQLRRDIVDQWPTEGLPVEQIKLAIDTVIEYIQLRGDLEDIWCGLMSPKQSLPSHPELHVFRWEDRGRVAVRWMGPNSGPHWADGVMSFARTVLYLSQLDHPHLAKLRGHTRTWRQEKRGIVLEHSLHGTLAQVLATSRGQVTPRQALAWAMQVADALLYLHSQDPPLVHGDLNSDSILIDIQWNAKLADLGGSLQLAGLKDTGFSTPGKRGATTKKDNVYSFGILLGLLATGKGPDAMWLALYELQLLMDSQVQPPGLSALMARCMDEQPDKRPDFGEVLEGLRLLESEGTWPARTWAAAGQDWKPQGVIIPYDMLPDPEESVREPEVVSISACATWLDPSDNVQHPPAASGPASDVQAGDLAGSSRAPPAPPHLSHSASPQPPVQPPTPSAPSTPQHTQPHAPTGGHAPAGLAGHAPGPSIADFAQSLLDSVGRWLDEQLRANRQAHRDLLKNCVRQMQEKLGGLWTEPHQLELGHVIGEGGYAVVWQAKQEPGGQQVALKQFHVFTPDGRTKVQSFIKEVCLLSQLKHTNIVTLHHFTANLQSGWLGIVLEWAGDSLAAKLDEEKEGRPVITPQQRLEWAIGIAEGLQYLHGPGRCIVHRDLTIRNIMINQHSQAKLIDLGISQVLTHTHLTVNRAACHAWMAPELLRGEQKAKGLQVFSLADEKSDIYSLGLCLGAMATHSLPWEGHDGEVLDVVLEFAHGARLGPPQVQQPWLQQLIQQCMSEEPGSRPAIGDVLSVLRQHSAEGILRSPGAWPVR